MRKKLQAVVLTIGMISMLLSGCTIGETEFVMDLNTIGRDDVISINGEECSQKEAKLYLCNYQNLYGNEYGIDLWDYEFSTEDAPSTLEEYVRDITLLQLSNIMCMNQLADQMDIALTEEEEELVKQITDEYYASLSDYELEYIGMDKNDLEKYYTKYARAEKIYEHLTQGVNEEVSLDKKRVMHIQQIYVTSLEKANEVAEKLEDGGDFLKIANSYNEASAIETTIARGDLPEAAETEAYKLSEGAQSQMIETEKGYYFIKCIVWCDEELSAKNEEDIIAERRKNQFDDVFTEFTEEAEFQINQKLWDSLTIDSSGEIKTASFFEVYDTYFTEKEK